MPFPLALRPGGGGAAELGGLFCARGAQQQASQRQKRQAEEGGTEKVRDLHRGNIAAKAGFRKPAPVRPAKHRPGLPQADISTMRWLACSMRATSTRMTALTKAACTRSGAACMPGAEISMASQSVWAVTVELRVLEPRAPK